MVKLKNDKTMLKFFSFILNSVSKKNSVMQRFYSLKFEKISYLAISFSALYLAVRWQFIQLKTNKFFLLKIRRVKSHSSKCKLLLDFPACHELRLVKSVESCKKAFSPFTELQGLEMYYNIYEQPPHQIKHIV